MLLNKTHQNSSSPLFAVVIKKLRSIFRLILIQFTLHFRTYLVNYLVQKPHPVISQSLNLIIYFIMNRFPKNF